MKARNGVIGEVLEDGGPLLYYCWVMMMMMIWIDGWIATWRMAGFDLIQHDVLQDGLILRTGWYLYTLATYSIGFCWLSLAWLAGFSRLT